MDIRLKNISYSNITKGIAVFLVWLCFLSVMFSAWFWLYNQEILTTKSYFDTHNFKLEYSQLIHNVTELKVKFHEEESLAVSTATPINVTSNKERINAIREQLANSPNFAYYIKNMQNGDIISNINAADRISLLQKQMTYIYIGRGEQEKFDYVTIFYYDQIRAMLEDTPYELRTAIVEPLEPGDMFYEEYTHFYKIKAIYSYMKAISAISIVLFLAALLYLIYTAGRKEKGGEIVLSKVDKLYTDVHTVLVFIAALLSVFLAMAADNSGKGIILENLMITILLSIDLFIGLSYLLSMTRQIKNRQLLKNSLIYKLYQWINSIAKKIIIEKLYGKARSFIIMVSGGKLFKPWILLILLGYVLVNGILFFIFANLIYSTNDFAWLISILFIVVFNVYAFYFAAKSLGNLTQIIEAVKEISAGNIDYELNKGEISIAFAGLADNLHNLQRGLKSAISEAVKGERMKTELITNVSHDLKTPLTSIINYVDLLKKEKLDNEDAKEYIAVLEEKSARLKQLVEDLIEASKASSGNLAVNLEKVDLHQLVMQAYGEYEEKLKKTGLDMRINTAQGEIFINADGRHLWRIVENLLTNVLKYSMPKSRVYVSLDRNEQYGILTIKNMSAFPLEISPEQLTERFVRGDSSRSTEGSGLGLSIAQGLTQLQGGRFKVEIDGDLFKVIIEIPLWKEV